MAMRSPRISQFFKIYNYNKNTDTHFTLYISYLDGRLSGKLSHCNRIKTGISWIMLISTSYMQYSIKRYSLQKLCKPFSEKVISHIINRAFPSLFHVFHQSTYQVAVEIHSAHSNKSLNTHTHT